MRGNSSGVPPGGHNATMAKALATYRSCQLLVDAFNDLFGRFHAMFHYTIISFVVILAYGAFRLTGWLQWTFAYWTVYCLVIYLFIIHSYAEVDCSAEVLKQSMKVAWSFPQGTERRAGNSFGKDLKVLRVLRVKAGVAFHYDKALVLTVLEIVVGHTIDLLITY